MISFIIILLCVFLVILSFIYCELIFDLFEGPVVRRRHYVSFLLLTILYFSVGWGITDQIIELGRALPH